MRIIYMGSPQEAVSPLEALFEQLVAQVAQMMRPEFSKQNVPQLTLQTVDDGGFPC